MSSYSRRINIGLPSFSSNRKGIFLNGNGNSIYVGNDGSVIFQNEVQQEAPVERKWVTLSNEALSLMQLLDVDVEMLKGEAKGENNGEELIPGEIYSLGRESVEGVDFDKIYFKLYGVFQRKMHCQLFLQ